MNVITPKAGALSEAHTVKPSVDPLSGSTFVPQGILVGLGQAYATLAQALAGEAKSGGEVPVEYGIVGVVNEPGNIVVSANQTMRLHLAPGAELRMGPYFFVSDRASRIFLDGYGTVSHHMYVDLQLNPFVKGPTLFGDAVLSINGCTIDCRLVREESAISDGESQTYRNCTIWVGAHARCGIHATGDLIVENLSIVGHVTADEGEESTMSHLWWKSGATTFHANIRGVRISGMFSMGDGFAVDVELLDHLQLLNTAPINIRVYGSSDITSVAGVNNIIRVRERLVECNVPDCTVLIDTAYPMNMRDVICGALTITQMDGGSLVDVVAGSMVLVGKVQRSVFRRLSVTGTTTTTSISASDGFQTSTFSYCTFTGAMSGIIWDCNFTNCTFGALTNTTTVTTNNVSYFQRCTFGGALTPSRAVIHNGYIVGAITVPAAADVTMVDTDINCAQGELVISSDLSQLRMARVRVYRASPWAGPSGDVYTSNVRAWDLSIEPAVPDGLVKSPFDITDEPITVVTQTPFVVDKMETNRKYVLMGLPTTTGTPHIRLTTSADLMAGARVEIIVGEDFSALDATGREGWTVADGVQIYDPENENTTQGFTIPITASAGSYLELTAHSGAMWVGIWRPM